MKFKRKIKRAATGFLTVIVAVTTLLGSTGLTAFAAEEPNPQPPANAEKSSKVYIAHHDGACFNGTITDSDECVPYGTDKLIEYAPNSGYLLDTVTVDGEAVDITTCPSDYNFADVQDDHHIKVVYTDAEMDKSVSMKESETIENYPENADIDGSVIRDGDVVTYTISYENPTSASRTILISDNVPSGVNVVDGSISDDGVLTDGKIIWTVQAEAYTSGTVSFDAEMSEDAEGTVVKNTAVVTLQPLTEDGSEKAVTLEDTVGSPILPYQNHSNNTRTILIKDVLPQDVTYVEASEGGNVQSIVQGEDNSYYLTHLADGTENRNGCPFLDMQNHSDFTDDNSIVYGHHMQNGTMFAGISWYEDQAYYDEHPVMYLMTPAKTYEIELFSGYTTTMDSSAYMQTFGSIREHTDWLKEISGRSDFRANLEISARDWVITLSTCAYSFENARYVLHGKLVELQ